MYFDENSRDFSKNNSTDDFILRSGLMPFSLENDNSKSRPVPLQRKQ